MYLVHKSVTISFQELLPLANITGRDTTLLKCKMLLISRTGQAANLTSHEDIFLGAGGYVLPIRSIQYMFLTCMKVVQ